MDKDIKDILNRYQSKLKENVELIEAYEPSKYTQEYTIFREEALKKTLTTYEVLCNFFEKIIKVNPKEKDRLELEKSIETSHLQINPEGSASFAFFIALFLTIIAIFLGVYFYLVLDRAELVLLSMLIIIIAFLLIKPLTRIPNYIAARWRLRASNQMVLCILYVVMYMRHTSNLEHAIKFASDHIGNPLALDLRKVFWDIETSKYSNIKESLDNYLKSWRDYNLEFVEAFHLIEGSLYEASEDRRITLLEKALEVILNGTYEKMLHYAHELKEPITILHMLGVVLPILGLVILPLFGSLLQGSSFVKIIILFLLYNIFLPILVYLIGINILAKRPTGYSESDLISQNKDLSKYKNILIKFGSKEIQINPLYLGIFIFIIIGFIGFLPFILKFFAVNDFSVMKGISFFDFKSEQGLKCKVNEPCYGPFVVGSVILSLFFPFGLALGFSTYYLIRTRKLIKIRNETKKLELEFAGGLFQLGNRIGDGVPVEVGFGEVAVNMTGTPTGDFFSRVSINIQKLGMSVKESIFNKRNGAIWEYPSSLIETSMKILLETSKKGPIVVSKALISISTYFDKLHQINERLKDLLSEVISSMKSQIGFLTPIIAGIVIGITTMIVTILGKLTTQLTEAEFGAEAGVGTTAGFQGLLTLFEIKNIIPSYYLQLIVGLYLVEVTIVLTILTNGIENGADDIAN